MSVGNLKNQGNKGFNTPFQLGTLQLLGVAAKEGTLNDVLTILTSLNTKFEPVTRTTSITRSSGAGSILAGAKSVTFYNAGLNPVSFFTTILLSKEQITFNAGGENDMLNEITWDATGTDLLVTVVR